MLHEAFQFQKDLCESTFSIATSVQENYENLLKDTLDLTPWFPAEGKKAYLYWSERYWSTLANLKGSSLMSIEYLEKIITPPKGQAKETPAEKKAAVPAKKNNAVQARTATKTKPAVKKTTQAKRPAAKKKASTASATTRKTSVATKSTTAKTAAKKTPVKKNQETKTTQPAAAQASATKTGDTETKVS